MIPLPPKDEWPKPVQEFHERMGRMSNEKSDLGALCRYAAEKIEGLGVCQNQADTTWFYLAYKDGARLEGSDFRVGYKNFWPNYPDPSGAVALGRLRVKTLEAQDEATGVYRWTEITLLRYHDGSFWCNVINDIDISIASESGATPAEAEFRAICSAWQTQEGGAK